MSSQSIKAGVMKNSALQIVITILNKAGAFVFAILLARFLLPNDYGLYSIAFSMGIVAFSLSELGIRTTIIRYVSYAISRNKKKEAAAYFKYLSKIRFIVAFVPAVVLILLSYPIANYLYSKPELVWPLMALSIYFFIISISSIFIALFFTINKFNYAAFKEIIGQSSRIILALVVFLGLATVYYLNGIFVALIVSELLVLVYALISIRRLMPYLFDKSNVEINKRRVLSFLGYSSLSLMSLAIFAYVDILILGLFVSDNSYIGYYSSAVNLVISFTGLLLFSNVLLPVFTSLRKHQLDGPVNRLFRYYSIIAIPASFGLAVVGNYAIRLIYGYPFLTARYPLYILAFMIFSEIITGFFTTLFSARERPKGLVKAVLVSLVLNVGLNVAFVCFGLRYSLIAALMGAALATVISKYVYMLLIYQLMKKEISVSLKVGSVVKPVIASLVMAAAVYYLSLVLGDMSLAKGIVLVSAGVVVYVIMMLILGGVKRGDFEYLKNSIVKRNL